MKNCIALAIAISFCIPLAAKADESLCTPNEKIFFSCKTGEKIASICASTDYPAPTALLQYRFGSKVKAEMVWPNPPTSRAGVTFGNIMYSGGGLGYIRFAKGNIGYVVYSGIGQGWDKEGVMVEKNGKRIANHLCDNLATQDLWHSDLPEDDNEVKNAIASEIP